ncbi:PQ loop repeat-domain-containing protein [Suillus discolor]|uniref:PQ loop repeat-domain-containing protein n=1 Tax=Suillus discolor TaxID=1912936 RepID=A0A9P7FBY5_9AGAM|nr:PQ loop repeat-domain-containing protein [Suillus discolor]KAG2111658.1 PQ loop repeat-domain-containing protein [Suillus discolor]
MLLLTAKFSELLGYASIACWLGAQFPQVIENHKRQSCEGLALPFLCNWLLGDFSNLIGCLLTHQLPFQTYLATYFCIVDCSLLAQYFYYYSGRPETLSEAYVRTRSRTISTARRLSLDASHYRTLSTVAGNVAAAAALAAFPESHPEHRVSRKHVVDQPLDDTAPQVVEEAQDEVDDAVLSALSESFHSGRKRVSWSQERHDHQSSARSQASPVVPKSLQITAPPREFAAFSRGRPEQRVADAEEVEVVQPSSRAASDHRTSSRASRRGASMVLLGFGALFSVGALSNVHSRSLAGRGDSIGRVLADEVNIPHPSTTSSAQDTAYHTPSGVGVVTVELPLTLSQNGSRSQASEDSPSTERIIGRIFAWLCTSLYLTSRLPQIWKNYVRKSVDGLSMYLFVFAFLGNFFYVCSILTSPEAHMPPPASTKFFKESIPYLLGSGGTLIFDVTIVSQSYIYRGKPPRRRGRGTSIAHRASLAEEQACLLGGDALSGSYYGGRGASAVRHSRTRTSGSPPPLRFPSPSPPVSNQQFAEPQPDHLRAFVLDYLCHNCYTKTAQAFARDTAVRHLDKDGDEITSPDRRLQGTSADLTDEGLRKIRRREEVRTEILSGRIDEATALLNEHFPNVLAPSSVPSSETSSSVDSSPDRIEYNSRTVLDPTLLSLNLRIHAFIEACRTIPLPYVPHLQTTPITTPEPTTNLSRDPDHMADERYQTELILRAQKLYALVELLRKPEDRATYLKELENVGGLLAYKVPEMSPMSKYLDQARRERVADQINRAILYHSNLLSVSHLEVAVRYNSALWGALSELHIKVPTNSSRPAGVTLPPKPTSRSAPTSGEKKLTGTVEVSLL